MPDSPAPQPPLELPAAVFAELPEFHCAACPVAEVVASEPVMTEPIRGPDSPAAYRAVLGIWRL